MRLSILCAWPFQFKRFCAATAMGDGEVRGEALFTARGAWFVCYPSSSTKCRLTNFKQDELGLAEQTLRLFRELGKQGISDRQELMKAGVRVRACLRSDPTMALADLKIAALAAIGREGVGASADADASADAPAAASGHVAPADQPTAEESGSPPPQPPPLLDAPVETQECIDVAESSCVGESSGVPLVEDVPVRDAMLLYATSAKKTGKCVGIFPFVVWACMRRRPVQLLFGDGLLDVVSTYAPWALETMLPGETPRVAVFCRVVRVALHGEDHVVVRHLRNNADLANGNHWVAAVPCPRIDRFAKSFQHLPCDGRLCAGGVARHCLGPLRSAAAASNLTILATTANGDCAFDTMAFWDGAARSLGTWKSLRIEMANFIREHAAEEHWQQSFVKCGEYDPRPASCKKKADAMLAALEGSVEAAGLPPEVVHAVMWACGMKDKEQHVAERVARCMPDLEQEALVKWVQEQQPLAASALAGAKAALPSKRRMDVTIRLKRAWGGLFAKWCRDQHVNIFVRLPWGTTTRFWEEQDGVRGSVPDKQLIRFARAWHGNQMGIVAHTSAPARRRRYGGGRPHKAPALRELLFEWFCMVRGAIKTRLPLAALAAQARLLRDEYMRVALSRQSKVQVPQITPTWLSAWRRQYHVSLRTPNSRWKVSRPTCLERCRITWLNIYRVRRLCELEFGYSPAMEGFDQKPFHFNESGSMQKKSLHWKGVPEVPLKEIASAVRARWTATTFTSSSLDRFEEQPPLEAMFKGGEVVQQRLDDMLMSLCAGGDHGELSFFSAQVGPKGSYRVEHVVEFLRTHLEEAGPGRQWRILLADYYGPHCDDALFDLCWSRMYVLLLIGGGITGILQVPDTHLHQPLSTRYTELEMVDLVEQQRLNPEGCPSRSREACCRDLIAAWRHEPLHLHAKRGWWDNLLANKLDGSEDHLGRGTAKKLFDELRMDRLREQALADVEDEWRAKRLGWQNVKRVIEPFPKRGELDSLVEGMDDEGDPDEIERGALAWNDKDDLSESDTEQAAAALAVARPEVVIRHGLSEAQRRYAEEARERLARLYRIREDAKHLPNPRMLQLIEASIHHAEVQTMGGEQKEQEIAAELRAGRLADEERYKRPAAKRQAAAAALEATTPPQAAKSKRAKLAGHDHIAANARRWLGRPVMMHVPRDLDASDLGQGRCAGGTKAHFRCRFELFLRIARLYGNLDDAVQVNLDRTFRKIDDSRRRRGGDAVTRSYASVFAKEMQELQAKHARGEHGALAEWIDKWSKRLVPIGEFHV